VQLWSGLCLGRGRGAAGFSENVASQAVPAAGPYLYRATRTACLNLYRDRIRETDLPEGETWFQNSDGKQEQVMILQQVKPCQRHRGGDVKLLV